MSMKCKRSASELGNKLASFMEKDQAIDTEKQNKKEGSWKLAY